MSNANSNIGNKSKRRQLVDDKKKVSKEDEMQGKSGSKNNKQRNIEKNNEKK